MNRSENINELVAALSKVQGIMEAAPKDSTNPFFKSSYADLAAVWSVARKPLADNGLSVTQHPGADGNIVSVETTLFHSSGQWMASQLTMLAKDSSPQAIGSCITYSRRYAIASILGIASEEDDDGNSAQPTKGSPTPKPFAKPTPPAHTPEPSYPEPVEEEQGESAIRTAHRAKKTPEMPGSGHRARFLEVLGCQEDGPEKDLLKKYLVALGWLPTDKAVEQLHYRSIPLTRPEMDAFTIQFGSFKLNVDTAGYRPTPPYAPHGLDTDTLQAHPVAPPAAAPEWTKFIMPFGRLKGKTLGQFTPDEMAFYQQFEVEKQPKSPESAASQEAFRAALDQAKQPKG